MNRIRMYDKFASKCPDFYEFTGEYLILIWVEYDAIHDVNLVSAFATENKPTQFYTHKPTHHTGLYLFRKGNFRVYKEDIKRFYPYLWDDEKGKIKFSKFQEIYKHLRPYTNKKT